MRLMTLLTAIALLAGCATATRQGHVALGGGRYDEAARHFEDALAGAEPARPVDLIGLGIARYKLGALDEAHRALTDAAALAPEAPTAQLYLALIAIRRADDAAADAHLARYLALGAPPRLAAQLERTRQTLRSGPVTPPLRDFMAASLEDAYQWAGEVTAALAAVRDAELRWYAADRVYLLPRACRCR
jgi:tetratricopeptide (TPR) repeat protein